jgi:hypothetical protein
MSRLAWAPFAVIAVFAVGHAAMLLVARHSDGPIAWLPGGSFSGEIERGPEPDWSFAAPLDTVEVQLGSDPPRTVLTGILVFEGVPYLPVTFAPLKRWQHVVARNPRVVIRVESRLFERRAAAVTDSAHLSRLRAAGQAKYGPPFHATWTGDFTQYFRLDPSQ